MAEKKADLFFRGYRIGESKLFLDVNSPRIEGDMEINIQKEIRRLEEDKYEIVLSTTITNDSNTMDIFVKITARFDVSHDLDEKTKSILIEHNAPAILFPYIRAYISSLTGLSGLAPIIIPAINLSGNKDN